MRRVVRCHETGEGVGDYRWLLEIDLLDAEGPSLVVVGLNPSTASSRRSDPTLGKAEAWARRHGFGGVVLVNLFAFRTPDQALVPRLVAEDYERAVGEHTDQAIMEAAHLGPVVAAWGRPASALLQRAARRRAIAVVEAVGAGRMHLVGDLVDGSWPRHPRSWNHNPPLREWDAAAAR